jgi:hypothetical protein
MTNNRNGSMCDVCGQSYAHEQDVAWLDVWVVSSNSRQLALRVCPPCQHDHRLDQWGIVQRAANCLHQHFSVS